MTEYIKNPLSGKLRGVTYEDGKIIDVHIRDTDDVVKVFVPVRHGRWDEWYPPKHMILTGEEMLYRCSSCDAKYSDAEGFRFCPHCGARMDLEVSDVKSETVWYSPQGDCQ